MNQKTLNKLKALIQECEKTISKHNLETDPEIGFEAQKLHIYKKDLASLREGRMPKYSDHGDGLPDIEMQEYVDSIGSWKTDETYKNNTK